MAKKVKSIGAQVHVMHLRWPNFEVHKRTTDKVIWIGDLVGIERAYTLWVEYGLPRNPPSDPMFRRFPLVRVVSPRLELQWDAPEEAPLPHVYFSEPDIRLSPLCLFDPAAGEWDHSDTIALTTIPWAADWLACYEIWLATGRWQGGGRHAENPTEKAS
ncbi:hypothetical protein [Magnetospirillum sp. SS-4]|uniref:hypothetical protein n=1 Tax=Magnetospirillum sp. SS-4 TaxID=2681465 RepID=UPI00137C5598|nr:hypothetical protein [Magnetospirillum sp. SS-4]CAA7617460.1 conserved hypothetical protein [Magnetospirillum sp. SS-4]